MRSMAPLLAAPYGPNPTRNPLTAARMERGWSQGELGRRAGLSRETVCRLEREVERPSWITVVRLARALAQRPIEIFPMDDEGPGATGPFVTTSAPHGRHVAEE